MTGKCVGTSHAAQHGVDIGQIWGGEGESGFLGNGDSGGSDNDFSAWDIVELIDDLRYVPGEKDGLYGGCGDVVVDENGFSLPPVEARSTNDDKS